MISSPLSERVAALADDALVRLRPGPTRDRLDRIRQGLDQPLRVAVAGREKAGKSTFVNALLGQRVAPTDAGVCTKVVTWFRYGDSQRLEIRTRAGESSEMPLRFDDDGTAIIELGADPSEIQRVTIRLPTALLRDMTIIDTPGLASMDERLSRATEDLLFMDSASRDATERADALVFLLSPTVMHDDREALEDFTKRFAGLRASAGNAIGVLSRADQIGDGVGDPWPQAVAMAARQAAVLSGLVSTVVPLIGLLAESMWYLRDADVDHLATLATLDADTRELMLLDARIFLTLPDCPVPVHARRRLLGLLGRYGSARALDEIDRGTRGAPRMARRLEELSGITEVRRTLFGTFAARSDALRAVAGLAGLEALTYLPDPENLVALQGIRDDVERLELDPAMHRLREISAGQLALSTGLLIPAKFRSDLHRLLTESTLAARLGCPEAAAAAELRTAAAAGERRWRAYAADFQTPAAAKRIAETFARSYGFLGTALTEPAARA